MGNIQQQSSSINKSDTPENLKAGNPQVMRKDYVDKVSAHMSQWIASRKLICEEKEEEDESSNQNRMSS